MSDNIPANDLKSEIESILFASAKIVDINELAKVTGKEPNTIRESIKELIDDYENKSTSLTIADYGDAWKLTVKDKYMSVVEQVVTETELPKSVLETLAVIAFRHPILQSEVIKIRSNKGYDHLKNLEEMGFIKREKYHRTNKIHLTQKFFDYFEIPPGKLKEAFASFNAVSKSIEEKERELYKLQEHYEDEKPKQKNKLGVLDIYEEDINLDELDTYEIKQMDEPKEDVKEPTPEERHKSEVKLIHTKEDVGDEIVKDAELEHSNQDKAKEHGSSINLNVYGSDDINLSIMGSSTEETDEDHDKLDEEDPENADLEDSTGYDNPETEETSQEHQEEDSKDYPRKKEHPEGNKDETSEMINDTQNENGEVEEELKKFNKGVDQRADELLGIKKEQEKKKKDSLDSVYEELEKTKDNLGK